MRLSLLGRKFTDSEPGKAVNPPDNRAEVSKPAIEVFTDSGGAKAATTSAANTNKALTLSSCEPYREFIEQSLVRGRNAMAIWQDLVTDYGFGHL